MEPAFVTRRARTSPTMPQPCVRRPRLLTSCRSFDCIPTNGRSWSRMRTASVSGRCLSSRSLYGPKAFLFRPGQFIEWWPRQKASRGLRLIVREIISTLHEVRAAALRDPARRAEHTYGLRGCRATLHLLHSDAVSKALTIMAASRSAVLTKLGVTPPSEYRLRGSPFPIAACQRRGRLQTLPACWLRDTCPESPSARVAPARARPWRMSSGSC